MTQLWKPTPRSASPTWNRRSRPARSPMAGAATTSFRGRRGGRAARWITRHSRTRGSAIQQYSVHAPDSRARHATPCHRAVSFAATPSTSLSIPTGFSLNRTASISPTSGEFLYQFFSK
jgi:hypothetical protein